MGCGCSGGGSATGANWSPGGRLRYKVVSNGFTVSYGSEEDAKRHVAAHGGQIQIVTPGAK